MNVGFVGWRFETLGIQYLSACLKQQGHTVRLYFDPSLFYDDHFFFSKRLHGFFDIKDRLVRRIVRENPDLLCFSVQSGNYSWACEIASSVKRITNIPVIFGGIHPTSVPEIVINKDFIDFICVGEGDEALVELVEVLEKKAQPYGISNIWFKDNGRVVDNPVRPLIENLDVLPLPDKEPFYRECPHIVNGVYVTMVSRGCYYSCTYCCYDLLGRLYPGSSGRVRVRGIKNVIMELKLAKEKYKPRWIYFNDDVFPSSPEWLEEFSSCFRKEIGIPFGINSHIMQINERYVSLLSRAGCASVDVGIQSCYADIREKVLHRFMDNKRIEDAIRLMKAHRLYVYVDLMLGLSEETDEYVDKTISDIRQWKPDGIATLFLSYFPNTSLTKKMFEDGHISADKMNQIYDPLLGALSFVAGGDVSSRRLICNAAYYQLALFVPGRVIAFLRRWNIFGFMPQVVILRFFAHFLGFVRRFYVYFFEKRRRCFRFSVKKELRFYCAYITRWLYGYCTAGNSRR